jgi:hypothetical protein
MLGRRYLGLLAFFGVGAGCSSEAGDGSEEPAGTVEQALTQAQARVLGFESPTADWSSQQAGIAAAATSSQGSQALAVSPVGWTEITSISLAALGQVGSALSVDVRLPETVAWGEMRVVLQAPSLGLWWQELPSVSLVGLSAGSFHSLEFPLPSAIQEALSGSYQDLTIKLILNAPALAASYVIDNASFSPAAPPDPGGSTSEYGALTVSLPNWALPRANAATALHELRINDRTKVQTLSLEPADVASLGALPTNLGVESEIGDVTSVPTVMLRDRAQVFGSATTSAFVHLSPGALVHGASTTGAALEPGSVDFRLELGPRGPDRDASSTPVLPPGRYGRVAVQGGAAMTLSSGVYALNELYLAHASELLIDGSRGPVVVLASDSATFHGRVRDVDGGFPEWILAYSGTQEVPVNLRLDGSFFAPNAKVNVATAARHEGAVLAKDVELHQSSLFVHNYHAPAWQRLCQELGGRGGFCPRVSPAASSCAVGTQPWAVGRNGRDLGFPIELEAPEWKDACSLLLFYDVSTVLDLKDGQEYQTPRAMVGLGSNYLQVFGSQWRHDVRADAVAFGDLDGDGRDELVIGRGPAPNARLIIYDDAESGFAPMQEMFAHWGSSAGVRALAVADFDGDGRDEIAVGRNAPEGEGPELFVLDGVQNEGTCGPPVTFHEVDADSVGDRWVRGLAFGDVDNDGFVELLVARNGRDDGADRVLVKEVAEGGAVGGFANWPDADRDATAVAVGDLEGDGTLEIAVGRGGGAGARAMIYRYSEALGGYQGFDLHNGWGSDRGTTALAFGNLDADPADELVVGRNGCSGCDVSARVFVHDFQGVPNEYPVIREIGESEQWGSERGVSSLAIGDVDGDGLNEIVIGRDDGGGGRVLIFGGPLEQFRQSQSLGDAWGGDRGARSVAVAPRPMCQAREVGGGDAESPEGGGAALPESPEASSNRFDDRLAEVIEATIATFLPKLVCSDSQHPERDVQVLGAWNEAQSTEAVRRMMAGLAAIELGGSNQRLADEAAALAGLGFPALVNEYIANHVTQFKPAGTPYDFDFQQMSLVGLLYRFRNTRDPSNPSSFLLEPGVVTKLLNLDCSGDSCPDRTEPQGLQASVTESFSPQELCLIREITTPVTEATFSLFTPESENHALMINTWHYLVHQWVESADPRAGAHPGQSLPVAATTTLENKLMEMVARVVTNDMWETNARAYGAFSVRALELLASYAGSERLRTGARNALDYVAAKFAFQSLHGKRLPPMRRNWEYRDRLGVYENDYLPAQLGVLTGDKLFDTSPSCTEHCQYRQTQPRGFALESALSLYRVPDVIVEHMLNPDAGQAGFGSWARMQARYTEDHYRMFHDPAYHDLGQPGQSVEPAHEFYFRTRDYLNSAGGRHEHYAGFEDSVDDATDYVAWGALLVNPINGGFLALVSEFGEDVWLAKVDKLTDGTDFVSKPTLLLGNHDNGYWRDVAEAGSETLLMSGSDSFWASNNTGVYKNFALGYGGLTIPPHLGENPSRSLGSAVVVAVDAANTSGLFAEANHHLVIGTLGDKSFWEVVPRDRFDDAEELLDHVEATNAVGLSSSPPRYTTAVSGETLTINPDYPAGHPFLAINGGSPADLHHTGASQTAHFPMMDVRQVDASYQFTGVHYACANGDGRLVVYSPSLGRQLVIDSSDAQNPVRNENGTLVNPCPAILGLPSP